MSKRMVDEGFTKVAHRYDQFTKAQVTVWHKRSGGEFQDEPVFVIEVNDTCSQEYTEGELTSLQDCLRQDLDLKRGPGFGM